MKNNLSSEDMKKCPNVLLFGILNSENMLDFICWRNTKILKSFSLGLGKLRSADVKTFSVFAFHFWVKNWRSAGVMTFFCFSNPCGPRLQRTCPSLAQKKCGNAN